VVARGNLLADVKQPRVRDEFDPHGRQHDCAKAKAVSNASI
jgi:hypothetical protein